MKKGRLTILKTAPLIKKLLLQKNVNDVFIQLNLDLHDIRFYAAKSSIERTKKEKEKSASDRSRQKEELKQRNISIYYT